MPASPRALVVMDTYLAIEDVFDSAARSRISTLTRWQPAAACDPHDLPAGELAEAEAILASWGMPVLDEAFLARAPRLRAVIYAAGSVKGFMTDAAWRRGIQVSSGAFANALPVAEYTVAAILFAGKGVLAFRDYYRDVRKENTPRALFGHVGNYRRTVGIIGASRIGRRVLWLLRDYDLELLVCDPFLSREEAERLGADKVPLDELCARSDIVSMHAPELPETRHLLDERRIGLLRDGATVINTARGSLLDTGTLSKHLEAGRLNAVLDVVDPVPEPGSGLFTLPNVLLTPHVAGSVGNEVHRLGDYAVAELERYVAGRPFAHSVTRGDLAHSA